jgi:hypothetical protein
MNKNNKNFGISIIGILILGAILLLILSYFNISVRGVVQSPTGQDNINYVKGTSQSVWDKYLAEPAHYLWQDVWVNIFWKSFINNMQRIRDGQPTDLENAGNNLKVQ